MRQIVVSKTDCGLSSPTAYREMVSAGVYMCETSGWLRSFGCEMVTLPVNTSNPIILLNRSFTVVLGTHCLHVHSSYYGSKHWNHIVCEEILCRDIRHQRHKRLPKVDEKDLIDLLYWDNNRYLGYHFLTDWFYYFRNVHVYKCY